MAETPEIQNTLSLFCIKWIDLLERSQTKVMKIIVTHAVIACNDQRSHLQYSGHYFYVFTRMLLHKASTYNMRFPCRSLLYL